MIVYIVTYEGTYSVDAPLEEKRVIEVWDDRDAAEEAAKTQRQIVIDIDRDEFNGQPLPEPDADEFLEIYGYTYRVVEQEVRIG